MGVLALISVIDLPADTPLGAVVVRLGVVLVLLAVAHGITVEVLTRTRDRLDAENLTKQRAEHAEHATDPAETGVPGHCGVPAQRAVPPQAATPAGRENP